MYQQQRVCVHQATCRYNTASFLCIGHCSDTIDKFERFQSSKQILIDDHQLNQRLPLAFNHPSIFIFSTNMQDVVKPAVQMVVLVVVEERQSLMKIWRGVCQEVKWESLMVSQDLAKPQSRIHEFKASACAKSTLGCQIVQQCLQTYAKLVMLQCNER